MAIHADKVITGGRFHTMDARSSVCEAVAIRDGRFVAVGTDPEILELAGPGTERMDLGGASVLPGLIDTHMHLDLLGNDLWSLNFEDVHSADAALDRIAERASQSVAGTWIRGATWHPVSQLAEKRYLTRDELDSVAPDHPVCLPVSHFTMANSLALELAGIGNDTPDPEGGRIHRDANGRANGLLEESAEEIVFAAIPDWTAQEREAQLLDAMKFANGYGLTSIVSAAVSPATFRAHQVLCQRGQASLRASCMFAPTGALNPQMSLEEWEAFFARIGAVSDFGNEWLSYSGVKLQLDGGMTLGTALMRDGYPHDPAFKGVTVIETDRFKELVRIANRYGWRVGVHAVGDAAIDLVLDAYAEADAEVPIAGRRFIVIHGSLIRPDQMERCARMQVRVDAQSTFLLRKAGAVASFLGKEVADRAFPLRSMIDSMGLDLLGQGTDNPINDLDPFLNIGFMVSRKDINGVVYGPGEAITREEAVRLYTSAAARYAFREDLLGTIETGKLADLTVLSDHIFDVSEDALSHIHAVRTIVNGDVVHDKGFKR